MFVFLVITQVAAACSEYEGGVYLESTSSSVTCLDVQAGIYEDRLSLANNCADPLNVVETGCDGEDTASEMGHCMEPLMVMPDEVIDLVIELPSEGEVESHTFLVTDGADLEVELNVTAEGPRYSGGGCPSDDGSSESSGCSTVGRPLSGASVLLALGLLFRRRFPFNAAGHEERNTPGLV